MKRLFKGKTRASDFTEEDLPHNRYELFFDILRNQFRKLFVVSSLLFAFALPFLFLHGFIDFFKAANHSAFALGNMSEEAYKASILYLEAIFLSLNPLATAIFGIGLSGVMRITKRLCYLEPVFLGDDFRKGVKENSRQVVMTCFLIGLFFSVCLFVRNLDSSAWYLNISIALFSSLIYPVLLLMIPVSSVYSLKYGEAVSVSFRLYARVFLPFLPILLLFISPFFFEYIPDFIVKYLVIALFVLFFGSLFPTSLFLVESNFLDRYINKDRYPELVDKGIVRRK